LTLPELPHPPACATLTGYLVGRDKALRTLQYLSRFLAWYLYRTNHAASSIAPFETTKKQFGLTRKLMRVGKFVEHFKAAAIASDAKSVDPVLRYTAVGRQLGYAGYLLADNAVVVSAQHSSPLHPPTSCRRWGNWSRWSATPDRKTNG
jgi:peroxin-11B